MSRTGDGIREENANVMDGYRVCFRGCGGDNDISGDSFGGSSGYYGPGPPSGMRLVTLLHLFGLVNECETGNDCEMNEKCSFDVLKDYLVNEHGDDNLGDFNLFEGTLVTSGPIFNFQFGLDTLTLICTRMKLQQNVERFRNDFKIKIYSGLKMT